jgi:hypothetical protein
MCIFCMFVANNLYFEIAAIYFKTALLKNTRGDFEHVEIYKKIEYIWTSEYAVFYKMHI